MEKKFRKSLFLFRRDLRLEDNTGLIFALKSSEVVIPAFIFTPEQIDKNPFRSDHCLKFMLVDYDPAVNNGNWQWAASTGCDAQPYFRIFNPWNQQKKFDPECTYIKKWIPELRDLPPKAIHAWYQKKYRAGCKKYPAPMINHEKAAKEALQAYRSI